MAHHGRYGGAERHADADLLGPLRHQVGEHPIDADEREQERDRADGGRGPGEDLERPALHGEIVLQRVNLDHGALIDGANVAVDALPRLARVAAHAGEDLRARGVGARRVIDHRPLEARTAPAAHRVPRNADHPGRPPAPPRPPASRPAARRPALRAPRSRTPVTISSRQQMPIWPTTRVVRMRPGREVRSTSPREACTIWGRVACRAGTNPKASTDASATRSRKPKTRTSGESGMTRRYGVNSAGALANMRRTPASMVTREMPYPSIAAGIARSALSVRSCRTSRSRAAPSASRIPISRCRAMPRASITLATLAQAMSSTSPNATTAGVNMAIVSGVRGSALATEKRSARVQRSESGKVAVAFAAQVASAARACRSSTPGLRRSTARRTSGCFAPKRSSLPSKRLSRVTGAQKSGGRVRPMPGKRCGATA